ncbi:MAG: sulfite reductase (ferredoxin), partial [Parvicellaceae bacterium]
GQELGRKLKFSFSSGDDDTALSYMHDLGFIPRIKDEVRGFKILVGGGLGSQSRQADVLYDFAPANQIIGITEAVIRVFEKQGERTRRMKARLKFLLKEIGIETFKNWINEELENVPNRFVKIDEDIFPEVKFATSLKNISWGDDVSDAYQEWLESNTFLQKESTLYGVGIKVHLGDFYTDQARALAKLVIGHTGNELTFTLGQNIIIRHVKASTLPFIYRELEKIGLADSGFNSIADVTACPGTDTCNLGISSSTGLAVVIEDLLKKEYTGLIKTEALNIKISGCMNACGQHMIAHIGFQGMSMNGPDKRVLPAIQVLLGGSTLGGGVGRFADKVIKIPSKKALDALRLILNDYSLSEKSFLDYYDDKGERYFYDLLKPLSGTENLLESDYLDWGDTRQYVKAVGIGECAGVVIDLVSTLLVESEDKINEAKGAAGKEQFSDAIYYTYQSIVNTAKALLIAEGKKTNSHQVIIKDFDEQFIKTKRIKIKGEFSDFALKHQQKVTPEAVKSSIVDAVWFYSQAKQLREQEVLS